jgi:hypothetical protein
VRELHSPVTAAKLTVPQTHRSGLRPLVEGGVGLVPGRLPTCAGPARASHHRRGKLLLARRLPLIALQNADRLWDLTEKLIGEKLE